MKKIVILLALLALSIGTFSCGGGGAGSANTPPGENPGIPTVVQLLPTQYIAQTNAIITLHTKVLDGNGIPVPNTPVIFTNLSPIGRFLDTNVVKTDSSGIATVRLDSKEPGFATVQVEVNTGAGQVRDRKTVYFAIYSTSQLEPEMTLTVDGAGDDYILFEPGVSNDNEVIVTATVYSGPFLVSGSMVTFGADRPYKVGTDPDAKCSDGSDTCDVIFPFGNMPITNNNGEASVLVRVVPTTLTSIETTLNVYAQSCTGAFNMVTLFLKPVSISTVTVYANPLTVESKGTSKITAYVTTSAGTPAPDGTTVNFTTNKGGIDPFSQTTDGWTEEVTFTAPEVTVATTATITASVGVVSDSVVVTITGPPPLSVTPPTVTIKGATGGTATFTVSGGTPAYTITSNNPLFPPVPTSVATSGGTFTVTVPSGTPTTTVLYTIQDTKGLTTTATLQIETAAGAMTVAPLSAAICENTNVCSAGKTTETFTITGGTAPYAVTSDTPAVIPNPGLLPGNTFTVDANDSITADTTVILTITDSAGPPATVTRTVTVINQT